MLPLVTGSWKQRGGGLLLSTSGSFPYNSARLQMPELMQASELGRAARVVNMNELGWALTELGRRPDECCEPTSQRRDVGHPATDEVPVKALFVYNCNAAAVAPDSEKVLAGLRREDLFTVVHEQFFTDTTDYADVVLPATTFLEHKELMGAYGHLFAQISQPAIAPLGEARSNVALFAELGRRMFPGEAAFEDGEEELIAQALDTAHPFLAGVTQPRLEAEGHVGLTLPVNEAGEALPFSTPAWFKTPTGRGELTPVPRFVAAEESRGKSAAYPLEFLPRKADNFMNTTFANLPGHQQMERRTAGVLEMHSTDAAARGLSTGDGVTVWNGRGRITLVAHVGASVPQGVVGWTGRSFQPMARM
jgi:anaerobic selenocysteine-containing dehydrogenase